MERFQEQHIELQNITQEKINKLNTFRKEYENLAVRLTTLPDKLSHEIMVPFTSVGFMPGKLVHCNEILVALGDDWFAEMSATSAVGVVRRRIKGISAQINDLNKELSLIEPRIQFSNSLLTPAGEGQDDSASLFEIKEDYDEAKEETWRVQHKLHLKKSRLKVKATPTQLSDVAKVSEEEREAKLWAALELKELEDARNGITCEEIPVAVAEVEKKQVRWKDKCFPELHTSESSDEYSSASLTDEYDEEDKEDEDEEGEEGEEGEEEDRLNEFAAQSKKYDLYKKSLKENQVAMKELSISGLQKQEDNKKAETPTKFPTPVTAFTGGIVERNTMTTDSLTTPTHQNPHNNQHRDIATSSKDNSVIHQKPKSRFKASRNK